MWNEWWLHLDSDLKKLLDNYIPNNEERYSLLELLLCALNYIFEVTTVSLAQRTTWCCPPAKNWAARTTQSRNASCLVWFSAVTPQEIADELPHPGPVWFPRILENQHFDR